MKNTRFSQYKTLRLLPVLVAIVLSACTATIPSKPEYIACMQKAKKSIAVPGAANRHSTPLIPAKVRQAQALCREQAETNYQAPALAPVVPSVNNTK